MSTPPPEDIDNPFRTESSSASPSASLVIDSAPEPAPTTDAPSTTAPEPTTGPLDDNSILESANGLPLPAHSTNDGASPAAEPSTSDSPAPAQPEPQRARAPSIEVLPRDIIQIVDALKTSEGAAAPYIVYSIRFEGVECRRRYSDFYSLRQALVSLYPCYIVAPLPPKNSLSSYAAAGTHFNKAKEDHLLIQRRRRTLATFLYRLVAHPVLGLDRTFRRFLDPSLSWHEVLNSPPVTLVPKNPLRCSGQDPTNAEHIALFAHLPLPGATSTLHNPDQRFLDSEAFTAKFSAHLQGSLEKVNRRLTKRWHDAAKDWGEMGGGMNGFALRMGESGVGGLEEATEKVGAAVDEEHSTTNAMLQEWERRFTEPLEEYTQFSAIIKHLLKYRHLKHVQYEMTREVLDAKRATLEELERSEQEAQRLERALARVRIVSEEGGGTERAVPEEAPTEAPLPPVPSGPRKSGGLLGALTHTFHAVVDADPEATRKTQLLKTRDSIASLEEALKALTTDLRWASQTIQSDLDRFQRQKVGDLRDMCLDFARFHKEWANQNLSMWEDAKASIEGIETD